MTPTLIHQLRHRLQQPLPGTSAHEQMQPRLASGQRIRFKSEVAPREGAVLLLLYASTHEWHFPLIQRPAYDGVHGGQVSLPGGKRDPQDADLVATSLREAQEEIGIEPDKVQILGQLSGFFVAASNHQVTPIVGFMDHAPVFTPDQHEVEEVMEAALHTLTDPLFRKEATIRTSAGYELIAPYYAVQDRMVWGATAMILSEFSAILQEL